MAERLRSYPAKTNHLAQSADADWDRPAIIAAVWRAGWTLRRLSVHHGLRPGTLADALYKRWPRGQKPIAAAIGVEPQTIWPSRYEGHP